MTTPRPMTTLAAAALALTLAGPAFADTIYQVANDTADSNTNNSYNGGVNFSPPPGTPTSENDYVNEQYVMQTSGAGAAFGGASLTLGGGSTTGTLRLSRTGAGGTQTYTINHLILNNGYIWNNMKGGGIAQIAGGITLQSGGARFNVNAGANSHTITIVASMTGVGSVTLDNENGAGSGGQPTIGEYYISGSNNYSGGTTIGSRTDNTGIYRPRVIVEAGSSLGTGIVNVLANGLLVLQDNANLSSTQTLLLNSLLSDKQYITLDYTGTSAIAALSFDGGATFAAPGTYGAIGSAATFQSDYFTGSGLLSVVPEPATLALFSIGGLMLMRRRQS